MSALRDEIRTGSDILRAIVRRRARNKSSLTRLANQAGIDRDDLVTFAQGASLPLKALQTLNDKLLRHKAVFDADDDSLTPRSCRRRRWEQWSD